MRNPQHPQRLADRLVRESQRTPALIGSAAALIRTVERLAQADDDETVTGAALTQLQAAWWREVRSMLATVHRYTDGGDPVAAPGTTMTQAIDSGYRPGEWDYLLPGHDARVHRNPAGYTAYGWWVECERCRPEHHKGHFDSYTEAQQYAAIHNALRAVTS